MITTLDEEVEITIDDTDYKVFFTVEASCSVSHESYEHFGFKGRNEVEDIEFELEEIKGVAYAETPEDLIVLNKRLEMKIRAELHEWISNHCDELERKVEF